MVQTHTAMRCYICNFANLELGGGPSYFAQLEKLGALS